MLSDHSAALVFDDVVIRRGRRVIIDGFTGRIPRGVTGLLGPNGAGKTTLLEATATLLSLSRGTIAGLGDGVVGSSPSRAVLASARKHSGFLPQQLDPPSGFAVRDFVMYAGWCKGLGGDELERAVERSLESVDLSEHARTRIGKLSGGMRQRLGIAAAIVHRPRWLLLDEPTVGLDPAQRRDFRRLIADLAPETSTVLSTHLTGDVAAMADYVMVIVEGRLGFVGALADLERLGSTVSGQTGSALDDAYLSLVEEANAL